MHLMLTLILLLAPAFSPTSAQLKCNAEVSLYENCTQWIDLKGACLTEMRHQIQAEIDACYTYLAMGAYFSRDTVNRPGFAEFFFNAGREERVHGAKLIEYLSMRGQLTSDVTNLIKIPTVKQHEWADGVAALEAALKLETDVTGAIRKLIQTCEKKYNYYHLVDYLTGVYLEEQLRGQRDLAGKLVTLKKMMAEHHALGEFLFDKSLSIEKEQ